MQQTTKLLSTKISRRNKFTSLDAQISTSWLPVADKIVSSGGDPIWSTVIAVISSKFIEWSVADDGYFNRPGRRSLRRIAYDDEEFGYNAASTPMDVDEVDVDNECEESAVASFGCVFTRASAEEIASRRIMKVSSRGK